MGDAVGPVALVGDSVFDNGAYVGAAPSVSQQLQSMLPADWEVTLLAVDGCLTKEVPAQLNKLPRGTSHVVVCTGGNDALQNMDLLNGATKSTAAVLDGFARRVGTFQATYKRMLSKLASLKIPATVCTIHFPHFEDPELQRRAMTVLSLFNDAIVLEATRASIPVLDLRFIFTKAADYANLYEPSAKGGKKLASAIAGLALRDHYQHQGNTVHTKA